MNGQMKDEPEKDLLSRVMLQDWCKREARLGIHLWPSCRQAALPMGEYEAAAAFGKGTPPICDLIAICFLFFVWPIILLGYM